MKIFHSLKRKAKDFLTRLLNWADEMGIGSPVHELIGRFSAELTLTTGKQGKGFNFMHGFWALIVFLLSIEGKWTPKWALACSLTGLLLFRGISRQIGTVLGNLSGGGAANEAQYHAQPPSDTPLLLWPDNVQDDPRPISHALERASVYARAVWQRWQSRRQ